MKQTFRVTDYCGVVSGREHDKYEECHLTKEKAHPIVYSHGTYFSLGKDLGKFGFSVKKH